MPNEGSDFSDYIESEIIKKKASLDANCADEERKLELPEYNAESQLRTMGQSELSVSGTIANEASSFFCTFCARRQLFRGDAVDISSSNYSSCENVNSQNSISNLGRVPQLKISSNTVSPDGSVPTSETPCPNCRFEDSSSKNALMGKNSSKESVLCEETVTVFVEEQVSNETKREDDLHQWLSSIGFEIYYQGLVEYGFDDLRFLNDVIDEEDCLKIGIEDYENFLSRVSRLPGILDIDITTLSSVHALLDFLKLRCYEKHFDCKSFMDVIMELLSEDKMKDFSISLGHGKRIILYASVCDETLGNEGVVKRRSGNLNAGRSKLPSQGTSDEVILRRTSPRCLQRAQNVVSLYSQATFNNPARKENVSAILQDNKPLLNESEKILRRDSSISYFPGFFSTGENFQRILKFNAMYLGTHPIDISVKTRAMVRGIFSKLVTSSQDIKKLPKVQIIVSYTDIKVINKKSKNYICNLLISKIFSCSQYENDEKYLCLSTVIEDLNLFIGHVFKGLKKKEVRKLCATLQSLFYVTNIKFKV